MSLYLNCISALSCKSSAFSVKPKFDDSQDKQKCIDSQENQYGQIEIVLEWRKNKQFDWKIYYALQIIQVKSRFTFYGIQ